MMTSEDEGPQASFASKLGASVSRIIGAHIDRTTLYPKTRWTVFFLLLVAYFVRIYFAQSFHVVSYTLGIHLLNLLIGFLSPQIDPETEGYVLPLRDADEYRPFQRRLPEFKFWFQGARAIAIAIGATFVPFVDLPVFWPVLLVYFIILFFVTMKHQIAHMIKYRYVPFSWGKQKYGNITRQQNTVPTAGGGGLAGLVPGVGRKGGHGL